jgi:succinate dehydrogenase flavin-adding protein (antitoxin of CptAB toxin-antitoxin module)
MTEPNFQQMSREELKAYVRIHREDDEAWVEFLSRRSPNAKVYPYNISDEKMMQVLREKLGEPQQD